MNVSCLDKSKSDFYYHIVGEEHLECYIVPDNFSLYMCYFGKWAILAFDHIHILQPFYDIVDQVYCLNNDSYTDSSTSSLYIIYIPIINVIYDSFCNSNCNN